MISRKFTFIFSKTAKSILTPINNNYKSANHLSNLFKTKLNLNFISNIKCIGYNEKKFYSTSNVKNEENKQIESSVEKSLMEFFDEKKNWAENRVKHGRPWTIDELRNKSNSDLHKLWYVLHKERNMLLTMEEYYQKNAMLLPSPERIAKVDESMENILAVVEERNVAYNLLETGKSKAYLPYRRYNSFGFIQYYRPREYLVPWYLNKYWKLKYHYKKLPYWSKFYRTLYRKFLQKERSKIRNRVHYATKQVLSKHPEFSEDSNFIKEHFEKQYGYKPPKQHHETIRKPRVDDLPKALKERIESSNSE